MNHCRGFRVEDLVLNRRRFITAAATLAAAVSFGGSAAGAVRRAVNWSSYPFSLGVASGDPDHESIVLWTRLAVNPLTGEGMPEESIEVKYLVAEDEGMRKLVRRGTTFARAEWGHSVHLEVSGLQPDRWYFYQFFVAGVASPKGRTRTMPHPRTNPERLNFVFASCQHFESGLFTAYEHMLREDLDLVIHLGDYIYEGPGRDNQVRKHVGTTELDSLQSYRNRLAQYKTDPALQAMHAQVPWLVTWDDHEVDNNYASGISEEIHVLPEQFLKRRARAYQAYYENMPLRRRSIPRGPDLKLYRKVSFGRLADFFVMDTRQYRSDQPCGDGNKVPCEEAMNPNRTLFGADQKKWLMNGLSSSASQWNVLAQQVMMARVDRTPGEVTAYSMDQWPGYERERREILQFFNEKKIANPVVLTGDIHTNWANELQIDFNKPDGRTIASEFVGTSISSSGDGNHEPKNLSAILSENPFVKFHNGERGYVRCQVDRQHWRTDYRTVPYVTRPGAPIATRKSFVVESGRPQIVPA